MATSRRAASTAVRRLQIEDEALLAGIELPEAGAGAVSQRRARAHHVAFGRLDLDHLGAEIGQQPGAMRTGDRRREIEHAKPVQGAAIHAILQPLHPDEAGSGQRGECQAATTAAADDRLAFAGHSVPREPPASGGRSKWRFATYKRKWRPIAAMAATAASVLRAPGQCRAASRGRRDPSHAGLG